MLTIAQFAAKIGKSRQRVHQLMREGRIRPAPERFGCYFLVSPNARIIHPDLTTVNDRRIR